MTLSSNPTDAVLFAGVCIVTGIACRLFLRGTRVPYTVALLLIGIALGSLEYGTNHGLGRFGDGIRMWENINPDLLLAVFLPALLFESSFLLEPHQIKRCIAQMLLLAGPGVLISTFCLGIAMKLTFPYGWDWKTSLLLGGLLSATDPVAVIAHLKELGANKKLSTIIEGESVMNDGVAIVVYQFVLKMVLGQSFNWAAVMKFVVQVSLGSVLIGIAFGAVSVMWLRYFFNDTVIVVSLTLAGSYLAYFAAQEAAGVSGIMTVLILGMFYAVAARTAFKSRTRELLHHFWEMVAYIANTLIFVLSGAIIAQSVLSSGSMSNKHGTSWVYLILLYVYVLVSRALLVVVSYPFLQCLGYGIDWKESIIIAWSGLRGAVALSLALSVKRFSGGTSHLSSQTGTLFLFFTGGIVFLTLVINGSTTQFALHLLGMAKLSAAKRAVLEFTKYEMEKKALMTFGNLGEDEELGRADWLNVKSYIKVLNSSLSEDRVHPHDASPSSGNSDNLKDIRVRLLNGVQAAYWTMLEEGRIAQKTANILMRSVDDALDLVAHEPLCDWKGLKCIVQYPRCYKFLQCSICPKKLVTLVAVKQLESACYICAAFLQAHRIAREQLLDFIGDSEISSGVINESEAEGEEARKFLDDVRINFPQVIRAVKTNQVTHAVLKDLNGYLQNLEEAGMLETKEMVHLHDAVQADLRSFLHSPPLVIIPNVGDLVRTHPLLVALPATLRSLLGGCTIEEVKVRGMTLYKEGSKPSGIWLITNGVVKSASKNRRNKHAMPPTFTLGSTLGLYETLTGKPYLCDMITDSVVVGFFIEKEKILSVLQSAVEDIFWKESVVVLAKILLPQIYESLSMQDMRKVIMESSVMTTYSRHRTFDVPGLSNGFLLEGCIRSHSIAEDVVMSPATLGPSRKILSFLSECGSGYEATSLSYQGSSYQVEATARVILFDTTPFQVDNAIQRQESPPPLDQSNGSLKGNGGLPGLPGNYGTSERGGRNDKFGEHADDS